jgi:N6-adenosine-specific RNA methylase IME4
MAALPVPGIVADAAHLYMWVTNPVLTDQRPAIRGAVSPVELAILWGFQPKTLLTWVKTTAKGEVNRGGTGWYFRGATEHVIFAVRGDAQIPTALREANVFLAPRSRHSAKPDALMEIAERVSPGPRLEMFARSERPGWERWGNEA